MSLPSDPARVRRSHPRESSLSEQRCRAAPGPGRPWRAQGCPLSFAARPAAVAFPPGGNCGAYTQRLATTNHPASTRLNAEVGVEPVQWVADAAENLYPARMQMALSLGWHII